MILFKQMIIFFIIMGIGFYCGKRKHFSDEGVRMMSWSVVNIANPALIIGAGFENASFGIAELLKTLIIAVIVYAILILISYPISRIICGHHDDFNIYRVMLIFSNIGFMGFPILSAVYGAESIIYASLFLFPYNFLIYTFGIRTISQTDSKRSGISGFCNAGTIACLISLFICLSRIPVPDFICSTVKTLGNLTAPLSMMVIGYSLTKINIGELIRDTRLVIFAVIKQVIIPLVGMLVVKALVKEQLLVDVLFIILAMPVGSMVAMFAEQYCEDSKLASKGVALTTVLSVLTIPLLSQLLF